VTVKLSDTCWLVHSIAEDTDAHTHTSIQMSLQIEMNIEIHNCTLEVPTETIQFIGIGNMLNYLKTII